MNATVYLMQDGAFYAQIVAIGISGEGGGWSRAGVGVGVAFADGGSLSVSGNLYVGTNGGTGSVSVVNGGVMVVEG